VPSTNPRAWSALGALAAFAVVVLALGVRTATPILSYDDIFRTLFAYEWSRHPYFFTERLVWLPFPLIATGVVIRLTGEAFWTALAVDLASVAVAILYVHRLTDRLFGRLAAWVTASLFGLTPWVVFLALSRYGEPVLLAAAAIGAFHWVRWSDTGKGRDLALASIALGAAVMTRYEAWPLGLALSVHAAAAAVARGSSALLPEPRPRLSAAWGVLPPLLMGIWISENLMVYGTPTYGGAYGFLPNAVPAGVSRGAALTAHYLWQLSPSLSALGLAGACLNYRRAPLLCWLAGFSVLVPWYTVSLFRVDVALPIRLMVLPLMLIAPFAGAVVAWVVRRHRAVIGLAVLMVLTQLWLDLRLEYPSPGLPMTLLARQLARSGVMDRFDALYVESTRPRGYPDEVRVATNFRRPVHVLPPDPSATPWQGRPEEAILVLNDGQIRPGGAASDAFVVARVEQMTAWGICNGRIDRDDQVQWLSARAPESMKARERAVVSVTLRNTGSRPWRSNACGVSLEHRWLRGAGDAVDEGARSLLPRSVEPGERTMADVAIQAPSSEGEYTLEFALMGERSSSSSPQRGNTLQVRIRVTGG
jgi:dolichyl-phosphate-mannose-protein mannosyltransferase/uncharacterized protein DUF1295